MARKSAAKSKPAAEAKAKAKAKAEAKPEAKSTTSANKAISVAESVDARAKAYSTNRWATLKTVDDKFDRDARKEVINISIMENGPPEINADLTAEGNEHAGNYSYQQVGPGVTIGMREGGEFESVDGFGWKDAADKAAHGNPVGAGATRLADVGVS